MDRLNRIDEGQRLGALVVTALRGPRDPAAQMVVSVVKSFWTCPGFVPLL